MQNARYVSVRQVKRQVIRELDDFSLTERSRPSLSRSTEVWETCRVTSAVTSLLDSMSIRDSKKGFVDGATGANDPVGEVGIKRRTYGPQIVS